VEEIWSDIIDRMNEVIYTDVKLKDEVLKKTKEMQERVC
jgi:hypothetical protein